MTWFFHPSTCLPSNSGVGLGVGLQSRVTPRASTPALATETLVLKQAVPSIVIVRMPGSTNTSSAVGDRMYFSGALTTTDGVASGLCVGSHTVVSKDGTADTCITLVSYRLSSGEQIDVTATSYFPDGEGFGPSGAQRGCAPVVLIPTRAPHRTLSCTSAPSTGFGLQFSRKQVFVRPIVGGTGRYAGAAGEVATRREVDGTVTHALVMLLPTSELLASSFLPALVKVGP